MPPSSRKTSAASVQRSASAEVDRTKACLDLEASVDRIAYISAARSRALAKLEIFSVEDLLLHFPYRYLDLSSVQSIASARIGTFCTIAAKIESMQLKKPKAKLTLVEITLCDPSGTLIVTCFRQPWLMEKFSAGMQVAIAGQVQFNYGFKRMVNPLIELIKDDGQAIGKILPFHPAGGNISTNDMRRFIGNALVLCGGVCDFIPLDIRLEYSLMSRQNALFCVHFPRDLHSCKMARRRFAFEELFLLQLHLMLRRNLSAEKLEAFAHVCDGPVSKRFLKSLPFALTDEQNRALDDIKSKMSAAIPMNHLLLGDVGCGKTVLAACAISFVADSATQAMMMAPTEILIRQHAKSMGSLFDACGISWAVLSGSTKAHERDSILRGFKNGEIVCLLGTHALLEKAVQGKQVSLCIIDEQQRFGVEQRKALLEKSRAADCLYLTATPIPRSLALALYGDLSLSYLTRRPGGHAERKTYVYRKEEVGVAYEAAKSALQRGEAVFVVCPLIDNLAAAGSSQSDKEYSDNDNASPFDEDLPGERISLPPGLIRIESESDCASQDISAAVKVADYLQRSVFVSNKVGLVHGRMKPEAKDEVMEAFLEGSIDVLVATSVIEVGIDVARASVMIILEAERFGLSQLHQLRGRVGRGALKSQVFLIANSRNEQSFARLKACESIDDGFALAEYDLSLRREGDILGNRQHGASALKLVNVVRDKDIVEAAHCAADALLETDPCLRNPAHSSLARQVRRFAARLERKS